MAHRKFKLQRTMAMIRTSGKWDLMDCLNEDGTISQNKRRKQLRDIKRKKKNGGNDGDASPRSENGY